MQDLAKTAGDGVKGWTFHTPPTIETGDVIGCSFDQSRGRPVLNFFHNGKLLENETIGDAKGALHPCLFVSGGAVVEANFGHTFIYPPPPAFQYSGIIKPTSLI